MTVWSGDIDGGRFLVEVDRAPDKERTGLLKVSVAKTGEVLLSEEVGLSYDAIFGPDVADTSDWAAKAFEVVDGWLRGQGEEVPT